MKDISDTICALSTPPGRSGIAIVRLSGPDSLRITNVIFLPRRNPLEHRKAVLGKILHPIGQNEIDEAVVTIYKGPHSFTGEDMAEYAIHGSPILISEILENLCFLGARPADPGEFTFRAFLNGKMDLSQAEAIHDIIEARTLFQAKTAALQKKGFIAQEISEVKKELIEIIVELESAVEFVEEELPVESRKDIAHKLTETRRLLQRWLETYKKGKVVAAGFSLAVIGQPNVGKSSLFNALLEKERSIVTHIPGTTRDTVSEYLNINGIPVHLMDTAGLRHSEDFVEKIGMEKSRQAMNDVDVIILVMDCSREPVAADKAIKEEIGAFNCIIVFNKNDLPGLWSSKDKEEFAEGRKFLDVSVKTGRGIEELKKTILKNILGDDGLPQDGRMITNVRQYNALLNARIYLEKAETALLGGLSEEFVLMDLHKSLASLGEITGETPVEDILTQIFSKFCIGK